MPCVPMLVYHRIADVPAGTRHPEIHVPPARFAEQLALLRALGRTAIPLSRYVAYRRGGAALPPRPVVITFDDGYLDNYEHALPILAEHGCPATVFLVADLLGGTNTWDPHEPPAPLLGLAHAREMQRAGVEFQSHTCTHARLPALPPATARRELRRSREALEQALGAPVTAVAYPWGAYDADTLRAAEDAGYEAGLIVRRRTNFDETPLLALRRIAVGHSTTASRLAWDVLRLRWRGA